MPTLVTTNNIKLEFPIKVASSIISAIPSSVSESISKESIVQKITDAFSSRGGFFNFKSGSNLYIILEGFISDITDEGDLDRATVSAKMDDVIASDSNTARLYAEFISKITPIIAFPINFLRSVIMDYAEKAYAQTLLNYQSANTCVGKPSSGAVIAVAGSSESERITVFNWGLIADANYRQQVMFTCQQSVNVFRNDTIIEYDISDLLKQCNALLWKDSIDQSKFSSSDFESILKEVHDDNEHWSSASWFIKQSLGSASFIKSGYLEKAHQILLGENPRDLVDFVGKIDSLQLTINHIQTLEKNTISTNPDLLNAIMERINILSKLSLYLHGALIGFKEVFIKPETVIIPCDYDNHYKVIIIKQGLSKYLELANAETTTPMNEIDACREIYKYPEYIKLIGGFISRLGVDASVVFKERQNVSDRLAKEKAANLTKRTEENRLNMYSAIYDALHSILLSNNEGWSLRPEIQEEFKINSLYTATGYDVADLMRIAADNGSRDIDNVREYITDFFVSLKASPGLSKIHIYIKDALKGSLKTVNADQMDKSTMETIRGLCISHAISLLLADFFRQISETN